jgi:glucokinase
VPNLVAVDLGGTSIRAARFAEIAPRSSLQVKIPTQPASGREGVIRRIIGAIEEVTPGARDGLRIGVGAPGPLDPHQGVILEAPNLPDWIDVPLQAILSDHFHCPVAIGNDANLAALGEWRFGAGQGCHDLLYLTLGTGIGGAVIAGDRLLLGFRGLATELGHMTVDPNGPMCGCGHPGHLEALASGPAIARRALELLEAGQPSVLSEQATSPGGLTAEAIGQAAIAGDLLSRRVVSEAGDAIGRHLANLVHAFNPEVIVLGGGVSRIGPLLFEPIERALHAHVIHQFYLEGLRLEAAALGDDAGLIGAMVLASEL